jgi:hypothetical protein
MNDKSRDTTAGPDPASSLRTRDELKAAVAIAFPQSPGQFAERLIKEKWGQGIDPTTAQLVTLDYDYKGRPAQNGIHQGRVASSMSLVQALLSNYQTVGDGRFGETVFGMYTPPDVGPSIHIVEHVDDLTEPGNDYHYVYEGIYRRTVPQRYRPATQIAVRPADFRKWIWELDLQGRYQSYLDQAWPADEVIVAASPHALKTSAKAAFVMAAFLQRHENSLSSKGLELALQAAGLPADQAWATLTIKQLQAPLRLPSKLKTGRLKLYRYTSKDIWGWRGPDGGMVLYIPGNSSPLHVFSDGRQLHQWVVEQGRSEASKQALATHFAEDDRKDGTFHAGVLTALDGISVYPKEHWLAPEAGFFNNDGFWDPAQYIDFDDSPLGIDPFAQLVLTMKEASRASVKTIRDDAQVNRDNLSAVVEPVVQWINRFGPLALFVPGGEGLLALAGIIDAGYGVDQAINGETSNDRSAGVTRTVFGFLNALPLVGGGAVVRGDSVEVAAVAERVREPDAIPEGEVVRPVRNQGVAPLAPLSRLELIRGIGPSVASFSDDLLAQIGKVSAIDDDMLRLMQTGRPPTPLLADTISRFKLDQELGQAGQPEWFSSRYAALQESEHEWVRLFQHQYPGLPKSAIEQMLDRYGMDIRTTPDVAEVRQAFKHLDSKARQYQQQVRLNRAYEGFYLRSIDNVETDTLALHSLKTLPGWPKDLRIDVLDHSPAGRVLDRCGVLDAAHSRSIIRAGNRYQQQGLQTDFFEAVLGILSEEERSALHLMSPDPANELRLKIGDLALPRSQTLLGLQRMDSGLTFERQGLRGGGYPSTPQGEAMTHEMMRLQLKDIYPDFTDAQADEALQRVGINAQVYIDGLNQQRQQLTTDLSNWMDQVADDVEGMGLPFLAVGDAAAANFSPAEIAAYNIQLLMDEREDELALRTELAEELVAIWQKREGSPRTTLDMNFENYHRLPTLNVRFDDVTELLMGGFHLTEQDSLNGFLESFPNLETLNLHNVDLRHFFVGGDTGRSLPPAIGQMTHLRSLNLRATELVFSESAASQLRDLTRLQSLDLSDNPLGVPPLVLGMNDLRQLNLRNTRISRCPIGIREEPYLTTLDLRDNQITRVPPAVINQAVADDRVLLLGNPLTDEDTLRRLVTHREQTGINLWLAAPGADYGSPMVWLKDCDAVLQQSRQALWQRLAGKPSGTRFLAVISRLSLTADFQVGYLSLQARVWRLLHEADVSEEMWSRLSRSSGRFDHPVAAFGALEDRANL